MFSEFIVVEQGGRGPRLSKAGRGWMLMLRGMKVVGNGCVG